MTHYQINPTWNHVDPVTVEQAAALMAGVNPDDVVFNPPRLKEPLYLKNNAKELGNEKVGEIRTCFTMLKNAITGAILKANNKITDRSMHHWSSIYIHREYLIKWLKNIKYNDKFFNPKLENDIVADKYAFLDPKHPRYSAELAMAVEAWEALEGQDTAKGREIEAWLEAHYRHYPNFTYSTKAINRIRTVVGWNPGGHGSSGN